MCPTRRTPFVFFFFVYTFPERKKRRWLRPDKNTIRKKNEKDSGERCARLSLCAQCSSTRPFSSFDSTAVYFLFSLKARLARKTERMRDAHTQREREVYNIICVQWPRRQRNGASLLLLLAQAKYIFLKKGNVYPKRRRRVIRLQRRAHFFCFLFFKKGNIEKLKLVGNPLFKFWFDFANKMRNESLSHSYFPICASFLDLSRTRFVFNVNNLLHQMKFRLFCFFYVGRKCNEPHPFGLMLLK